MKNIDQQSTLKTTSYSNFEKACPNRKEYTINKSKFLSQPFVKKLKKSQVHQNWFHLTLPFFKLGNNIRSELHYILRIIFILRVWIHMIFILHQYLLARLFVNEMYNIQLADLQLLLQFMLSRFPIKQQEQQLSYFLCTCGAEFELYNDYHRHLMQETGLSHQKPIYKKCDNYSNCSIVSAVKFQHESQESWPSERQEETNFEEFFIDLSEDLKQEESEEDPNIYKDLKSFESQSQSTFVKKERRVLKRWNDFMLVKNQKCKEEPFYCGHCQIIYFQLEYFVIHCVQQCHVFEHPASSHFITDQIEELNRNNRAKKKDQKHQIQERQLLQLQCEPFNEIFRQRLDHRHLLFYCGLCRCNIISPFSYNHHRTRKHQQKSDPSSSHIILRFVSPLENYKVESLYMSPRISWINYEKKYYCSCQPKAKKTMSQLLKHVQKVHNGVSPIYQGNFICLRTFSRGFQDQHYYQQFNRIHKWKRDHRHLRFFCGGCQFNTTDPDCYNSHIKQKYHGFQGKRRNSHIIIRLLLNQRFGNIYLSPTVRKRYDEARYYCVCDLQKWMNMKDLIEHVYVEHDGVSPYYPIGPRSRLHAKYDNYFHENVKDEAIRSIIALHTVTKQEELKCKSCGNGQILTPSHYADHILRIHKKVVDPSHHSHILIQSKYSIWQLTHYFYLPIQLKIDDHTPKYYCPCQIKEMLSLNDLIEHILKLHNGVSPCYSLDQ